MKTKNFILFAFLLFVAVSCQENPNSSSDYLRMVGDILIDPELDDPRFELCNDEKYAVQYYAFTGTKNEGTFSGGGYALKKYFKEHYQSEKTNKESGLIRIRFLVNCKGETGRFRMKGMDFDYQEKKFDSSITSQLLEGVKMLKGWKPFIDGEKVRDYYQYLIFKMKDGEIIEILP